jgi:hypothetical protein
VERQHGSSEETRTQIRREEERWQKEQSRAQRIGEEGSSHTCAEQGGACRGPEETEIGCFKPNETEKPAMSPAFLLARVTR